MVVSLEHRLAHALELLVIENMLLRGWEKLLEWFQLQKSLNIFEWFPAHEGFERAQRKCNLWLVVWICEFFWVTLV